MRKATAVKAPWRVATYWVVGLGLTLAYVLMRGSTWRGSTDLHTHMEAAATLLALIVGVMAVVRFYARKNNRFLFVGTGFLGTAFLDGYHAVVTSHFFQAYLPSDLPSLIPWSWVASRLFLSVLLVLSWYAWTREDRMGEAGRIEEKYVYLIASSLTLASFLFFAFVPLPRAYYAEFWFPRPEEFVPALFFLIALVGYLRKGHWRTVAFEHWLVLSLIVGFVSQAVFMSYSGTLFDFEFDAAHALKKVGYICVLTGLLISMFTIFKKAEANAKALESEIRVRQQTEHALAESERRFRHYTEVASDWVWEMGPDLRFTYMSERITDVSGLPTSYYLGKTRKELARRGSTADWEGHLDDLENRRPFRDFEFIMARADDRDVWVSISGRPDFDADGNFTCYRGTGTDVSERKRAEDALRASEERLAETLDIAPEGVITVDESGRIELFNKGAEAIFGHSAEEMIGQTLDRLLPPRFRECHRKHLEDFKKVPRGKHMMGSRRELLGLRKDGTEFPAEAAISKLESGGQMSFMVMMYDITERKRLEQQFSHAQKMDAIGQLTGGIAHDFNNLLMVIDGYARRTLSNLDDIEVASRSMEEVLATTEKAARLTKQLLAFSRRQIMEKRIFKVADTLRDIKGLLAQSVGEWYELEFQIADKKVCVRTDAAELSQAIVNLAVNARDAMPKGGTITIGQRVVDVGEEFTWIHGSISPGRYVRIAVTDRGTGIDEKTLQRIFEPFFTTKEQGKGTGLGLAMVYGFAEQSGGVVDVLTELGEGTTFHIYLPVVDRPPDEIEVDVIQEYHGKGETILLVEDDDRLLELTYDVLRDLGYTVFVAGHGLEALEIDEELEKPIDLLVSDVVMPSLGGFELYEILRERRPDLRAVFMSGYPKRGAGKVEIPGDTPFLQKPVRPDQLAQAIRMELDKTGVKLHG